MEKIKIVADDKIPFLQEGLKPFGETVFLPGKNISNHDIIDADALVVRTRTKCNATLLEGAEVKFIATATIGFDHIDVEYCESHSISWVNAPGCNSSSVAQYICSALLALADRKDMALKDKVLGVVGVGNVGKKVASVGEALGMRVVLNDPPRAREEGGADFVELNELLECADVVTCHVPLNRDGIDKTYHLAGKVFFERMKPGAYFFNSSRGEVVDTSALKNALLTNCIAGAVLDVWENEPDIDRELLDIVDIATPHIAGYSTDGKANGTSMSVNALSHFFNTGVDDWYPKSIPLPDKTSLQLTNNGCDFQKSLFNAVTFSYDILDDDNRLRCSVDTFESQRGAYPLRREFHVFNIVLPVREHYDDRLKNALMNLGFNVESESQ